MCGRGRGSTRKFKTRKGEEIKDGFEKWGGYMAAKRAKLLDQFHGDKIEIISDIFAGVKILVNGLTHPSAAELKNLMAAHGGEFHMYQVSGTTHIIASNLPNVKIKHLGAVPIVKPAWIVESIALNKLLDYKRYLLYTNQTKTQPAINFPLIPKTSTSVSSKEENTKCQEEKDVKLDNTDKTNHTEIQDTNNTEQVAFKEAGKLISTTNPNASTISNAHGSSNTLPKITKTASDPKFLEEFYSNSRLHLISTLGAEFKQLVGHLREKSDGKFPGKEKLIKEKGKPPPNMKVTSSVIMHIDMDCFFASVGLRNHPELRGKPVAITHAKSGVINTNNPTRQASRDKEFELYQERLPEGVSSRVVDIKDKIDGLASMSEIASCSYEARKYGIKNGMFMGQAVKLCPDLKTLPYDFEGYKEVSSTLYKTVASYTLDIEAVSCDEMYVDVKKILLDTGLTVDEWATHIRNEIMAITGCPCSTGFGANRLQARLATRKAKPAGQYHLKPEEVENYISEIPVSDLPGVGRATLAKLQHLGLNTCGDVQVSTCKFFDMFAVVEFMNADNESAGEVAIVPISWLKNGETRCYWPITTKRRSFSDFVKDETPYKSSWPCYKVFKVHFKTASYEHADKTSEQLINSVQSDSSLMSVTSNRSLVKKIANKLDISSSSSESPSPPGPTFSTKSKHIAQKIQSSPTNSSSGSVTNKSDTPVSYSDDAEIRKTSRKRQSSPCRSSDDDRPLISKRDTSIKSKHIVQKIQTPKSIPTNTSRGSVTNKSDTPVSYSDDAEIRKTSRKRQSSPCRSSDDDPLISKRATSNVQEDLSRHNKTPYERDINRNTTDCSATSSGSLLSAASCSVSTEKSLDEVARYLADIKNTLVQHSIILNTLQNQAQLSNIGSLVPPPDLPDFPIKTFETFTEFERMLESEAIRTYMIASLKILQAELGAKLGEKVRDQSFGRDNKPLDFTHERKSVSAEINYGIRFKTKEECYNFLQSLANEVFNRLSDINMKARGLTLKLLVRADGAPVETAKFLGHGVCDAVTKSSTSNITYTNADVIYKEAKSIYDRLNVQFDELRGVGIQLTKLEKNAPVNKAISNFLKQCTSKKTKISQSDKLLGDIVINKNDNKKSDVNSEQSKHPTEYTTRKEPLNDIVETKNQNINSTGRVETKRFKELSISTSGINTNVRKGSETNTSRNPKGRGRPKGSRTTTSKNHGFKTATKQDHPTMDNFLWKHKRNCGDGDLNPGNSEVAINNIQLAKLRDQIDMNVLNELPEDIRKEIMKEYQFDLQPKESQASHKSLSSDVNVSRKPKEKIQNEEIETPRLSTPPTRSSPFSHLSWDQIKPVVKTWVHSESEPSEVDVEMLANHLRKLALDRQIEDLQRGFNFLHRIFSDLSCVWHQAYFLLVNAVQQGMVARYGKILLVETDFSCCQI